MNTVAQNTGEVIKSQNFGEIAVTRVYEATDGSRKIQKEGTLTAELKQTVTTKSSYPTKSVTNSNQANIFSVDDFGFERQEYENSSIRTAWIPVPVGTSIETVAERLQKFPDARIQQILSNKPILTTQQKYAIQNGLLSLDTVANSQVVRYGANSLDAKGVDNSGKIVLDNNGKPIYRVNYFQTEKVMDQDLRTSEPTDFYASPELEAEMKGLRTNIF